MYWNSIKEKGEFLGKHGKLLSLDKKYAKVVYKGAHYTILAEYITARDLYDFLSVCGTFIRTSIDDNKIYSVYEYNGNEYSIDMEKVGKSFIKEREKDIMASCVVYPFGIPSEPLYIKSIEDFHRLACETVTFSFRVSHIQSPEQYYVVITDGVNMTKYDLRNGDYRIDFTLSDRPQELTIRMSSYSGMPGKGFMVHYCKAECGSRCTPYDKHLIKKALNSIYGKSGTINSLKIEKVIHNNPATIVFWSDGTKTVVKAQDGDVYDPEKGLAMAISKKFLGNTGFYYEIFKYWCPEEEESNAVDIALKKLGKFVSKAFTDGEVQLKLFGKILAEDPATDEVSEKELVDAHRSVRCGVYEPEPFKWTMRIRGERCFDVEHVGDLIYVKYPDQVAKYPVGKIISIEGDEYWHGIIDPEYYDLVKEHYYGVVPFKE